MHDKALKNIILGSVNFGMDYGVTNHNGMVRVPEINRIIQVAKENRISYIDTSPSYGISEKVLGNSTDTKKINFITKTSGNSYFDVIQSFNKSLHDLKIDKAYGLLVHDCDGFFNGRGKDIYKAMRKLSDKGLVKKIGFSVYTDTQIHEILNNYNVDIIQLPFNIVDQRLLNNGLLKKIKEKGIEIHARSVFFQGVLTAGINNIPAFFKPILKEINRVTKVSEKLGVSNALLSMSYVSNVEEIDKLIIGVNNSSQLKEIVNMRLLDINPYTMKNLSIDDSVFLDPSNWREIQNRYERKQN